MEKSEILQSRDEALKYYEDLAVKAVKEGWSESVVNRTLEEYTENIKKITNELLAKMEDGVCTDDDVRVAKRDLAVRATESEFRARTSVVMEQIQREETLRKQSVEFEKQRTERLRQEKANDPNNLNELNVYLQQERNVHAVQARELADTLYSKLTDQEKDYYFNNPIYAAYEKIGTQEFETSLQECIIRYHNSLTIKKKINDYLDMISPERDRDDYEIDKLIELLPDNHKKSDDRMYQAYTAICWLEDKEAANNGAEELNVDDIKIDTSVYDEFVAEAASNINHDEPYDVAYRSGLERAIGTISKKYGQVKAMPKRMMDVANQSVELGERETLGDNLYEKVKQDKELEAILRARDQEREEYERKLEELEKKVNASSKETKATSEQQKQMYNQQQQQQQMYNQQQPYVYGQQRYGYNQQRYGYQNQMYGQQPQQQQGMGMKLIGILVNAGLFILCLLADKVLGTSTWLMWIGLGLATYGWVTMPVPRQYGSGNYYQNQPANTGINKTQSKWLWFVIGGYAEFVLTFFLLAAL